MMRISGVGLKDYWPTTSRSDGQMTGLLRAGLHAHQVTGRPQRPVIDPLAYRPTGIFVLVFLHMLPHSVMLNCQL